MKRLALFTTIILLSRVATQAMGFVIIQKVESAGQAGEITLQLDNGKARADLSPTVSLIINGETGEQVSLMHQNRKFLRITSAEGEKLSDAVKKDRATEYRTEGKSQPKLEDTGQTATVAGQNTEIYKFETGSLNATYWIAKDFPDAKTILENLQILQKSTAFGVMKSWMPSPADFPGLPLKTEIVLGDRKVTNTLISIVRRNIDPSVFEIPEDYISVYMGGRGIPGVMPGMAEPASRNP